MQHDCMASGHPGQDFSSRRSVSFCPLDRMNLGSAERMAWHSEKMVSCNEVLELRTHQHLLIRGLEWKCLHKTMFCISTFLSQLLVICALCPLIKKCYFCQSSSSTSEFEEFVVISYGLALKFPHELFHPPSGSMSKREGLWVPQCSEKNLDANKSWICLPWNGNGPLSIAHDSSLGKGGFLGDLRPQGPRLSKSLLDFFLFLLSLTKSWLMDLLRENESMHIYVSSQSHRGLTPASPLPVASGAKWSTVLHVFSYLD